MLLNNQKSKHPINNDFQNRGPEYAIIQFSKFNVFKTTSIWFALFVSFVVFGFFVSSFVDGDVNYQISQLGITISIWGLIAFVLLLWFLSYTRRFNYELSFINYLHVITLTFVFTMLYLFYKLGLFGTIHNSKINYYESINAIKILLYLWMALYFIIISSWYLVTFLSRKKYQYAFVKASFLAPIVGLFLTMPFLIFNFSNSFDVEKEIIFLIVSFFLIICFGGAIGFLSKYQTIGETNLKIVNRVFGSEISYASFGALIGGFSYQIYWTWDDLEFTSYTIISMLLSIIFTFLFLLFIFYRKKRVLNSFLNKIISKIFIIILLSIAILLVYLSGSSFSASITIVIAPLISILVFLLLMGSIFKFVIFERWPTITKVSNSVVAFLFIFLKALITTLEDGKIIYDWLGHFLIIFIVSFYICVEIFAFLPELSIVLLSFTNKLNPKPKLERIQND